MQVPYSPILKKGGIEPIDPRLLTTYRYDENSARTLDFYGTGISNIRFEHGVYTTQPCQQQWSFCSNPNGDALDPLGNIGVGNSYSNYARSITGISYTDDAASFWCVTRNGGSWYITGSGGFFVSSGANQNRTMWGYSNSGGLGFGSVYDDLFVPCTYSNSWKALITTYNHVTKLCQIVYDGVFYSSTLSNAGVKDVSLHHSGITNVYHPRGIACEAGIVNGVEWTEKEMRGVELHLNEYWGL